MTWSTSIKALAAHAGYHVVGNSQNPAYTLMGLRHHKFGTVLDVGANSGQFAREMRPNFLDATFHCFEPVPAAFSRLSQWAARQQGVIPVCLALGDRPGRLEMNFHVGHDTSSSLLPTTRLCETIWPSTADQCKEAVEVQRLDDYVRTLQRPLDDDIFLKLDVQGYEAQVLRGAPEILKRIRASMVEVSLDLLYEGQAGFLEILKLMAGAGLEYSGNFDQAYGADGHVLFFDALFLRRT